MLGFLPFARSYTEPNRRIGHNVVPLRASRCSLPHQRRRENYVLSFQRINGIECNIHLYANGKELSTTTTETTISKPLMNGLVDCVRFPAKHIYMYIWRFGLPHQSAHRSFVGKSKRQNKFGQTMELYKNDREKGKELRGKR